jgi:hypothetical protein
MHARAGDRLAMTTSAAGILETFDGLPHKPKVEAPFEAPRSDDVQPISRVATLSWLARDAEPGCRHGELLVRALHDIDLQKEIVELGGNPLTATNGSEDEQNED